MDGLWQGPNAITQNFQAVVWRIKLMGFNTVRIPFSFQVSCSLIAVTAVMRGSSRIAAVPRTPGAPVQPLLSQSITLKQRESQHCTVHDRAIPTLGTSPVKTEQ